MLFFNSGISIQESDCKHGEIRLRDGSNILEGRLEICINQVWGTVCSVSFSADEAETVCRHLNFTSGL